MRRALRWNWRTVCYGPIEIRTPPTWGEIEQGPDGMLVLHNRPLRLRVDGDAVWYGSTIELRMYHGSQGRQTVEGATRYWRRRLAFPGASLIADLHVANGVTSARTKEAQRVLHSLHLTGDPGSIVWPAQQSAATSIALRPLRPPHDSNVARDFESFEAHEVTSKITALLGPAEPAQRALMKHNLDAGNLTRAIDSSWVR
ncbi:hypothetical protein ACVWW1_000232 [Bradyrhizobium sp. JR3.5]